MGFELRRYWHSHNYQYAGQGKLAFAKQQYSVSQASAAERLCSTRLNTWLALARQQTVTEVLEKVNSNVSHFHSHLEVGVARYFLALYLY